MNAPLRELPSDGNAAVTWRPGKLWSLWEMLRFYADKFARTTDDIGAIRALATTLPRGTHLGKETGDSFKENIVDLIEQLRGMKLKMTQLTAERLLKELESGYIFNDNIVFLLNQIMERSNRRIVRCRAFFGTR